MPGLEFFSCRPFRGSPLKFVVHRPLNGAVHPPVIKRRSHILNEVPSVPSAHEVFHFSAGRIGIGNECFGILAVNRAVVIQLNGLGIRDSPIVFGLGKRCKNASRPSVPGVKVAGVANAVVGLGSVVCRVDKATFGVDELWVHVKSVPTCRVIGGVGAVDGHLRIHMAGTDGQLGAHPPTDIALPIPVHQVDARRVHQLRTGRKRFNTASP